MSEYKSILKGLICKHFNIKDNTLIHFSGICGIGMSGIAIMMKKLGLNIQGSDISTTGYTAELLKKSSILLFNEQKAQNLNNVEILVKSSSIHNDNEEIIEAKKRNIKIILRAELLAILSLNHNLICVAGTHGKTTTTSMLANILVNGKQKPNVANGGFMNNFGTNILITEDLNSNINPENKTFLIEADESDKSFLNFYPRHIIITNIDQDHMENYSSMKDIKNTFKDFILRLNLNKLSTSLTINLDDTNSLKLFKEIQSSLLRTNFMFFSLNEEIHWEDKINELENLPALFLQGYNISYSVNGMKFDLKIHSKDKEKYIIQEILGINLKAFGKQNISNALAALCNAIYLGIEEKDWKFALKNFEGTKRRFTKVGHFLGALIIDDYAHHPKEIIVTINAAKNYLLGQSEPGKLFVCFQPHRYSRFSYFMKDFLNSFSDIDFLYITDPYSAGENIIEGATTESFISNFKNQYPDKQIDYFPIDNTGILIAKIKHNLSKNDLILFLGAGDISSFAYKMIQYK